MKKKCRQALFHGFVRLIFNFPVEQFLPTGLHTVRANNLSILCMYESIDTLSGSDRTPSLLVRTGDVKRFNMRIVTPAKP